MPKIEINRERCKGCCLCIEYCPNACIIYEDSSINKGGAHPVFFSDKAKRCTGCSLCAIICPDVCIEVYK